MSDFTRINRADGNDLFVKVDKTNGAVIICPGKGTVNLSADDIVKILNFRRNFDYQMALKNIRIQKGFRPIRLGYNVENETTKKMILVDFFIATEKDAPSVDFKTVDIKSAVTEHDVSIDYSDFDKVLQMFDDAGFKATAFDIKDIKMVAKLPNETAADSAAAYCVNNKWYKLNAAEDGYTEITGTFKKVPRLLEFVSRAEEDVLYHLTTAYTSQYNERFEPGVYSYKKNGNKHTLEDIEVVNTKRLPKFEDARENVVYILTRNDGDKEKGSQWKKGEEEFEAFETQILTVTSVPFIPLAEDGVYYIASDVLVKKAANGKYQNIGKVTYVDELPDTSVVALEAGIVYVLTENMDATKKKGSRWVFDFDKKEFVAYAENVANTEPEGSDDNQQQGSSQQQQPSTPTPKTYVQATGTYVAGTTYYTDNTGSTEVNTTNFEEGVTDVSSFFVEA